MEELDKYLVLVEEDNGIIIPVKFREIVLFMKQLGTIRAGLLLQKVSITTIDKVMQPFEQIYSLLFGENTSESNARRAIYTLVFAGTCKPILIASPIFDVITNENIAKVIQSYLINNSLRSTPHIQAPKQL